MTSNYGSMWGSVYVWSVRFRLGNTGLLMLQWPTHSAWQAGKSEKSEHWNLVSKDEQELPKAWAGLSSLNPCF